MKTRLLPKKEMMPLQLLLRNPKQTVWIALNRFLILIFLDQSTIRILKEVMLVLSQRRAQTTPSLTSLDLNTVASIKTLSYTPMSPLLEAITK